MLKIYDNKGFTLVELLVSMCILAIVMAELMALMFNSSKLYKNGAYEVGLQSEAQQIIMQFEELVIDADTSVSYNGTSIQINNSTGYNSYELTLSPVTGKSYSDLLLSTNGGSGQLMGEYVKSVSLDMANYDDASRIRLIIDLENDKYSYSAAKDIYLRNDIGSNDIKTTAVVSEACDYKLNVLRFKKYDIDALFANGGDYIYAFDEDVHSEFEFSGPYKKADVTGASSKLLDASFEISTSISFNSAGGDDLEPHYIVRAYEWDDSSTSYKEAFKIEIYAVPVFWGLGGYGCAFLGPTSSNFDNYFSVQGVSLDPTSISKIECKTCLLVDVNDSLVTSDEVNVYGKVGGGSSIFPRDFNDDWKVEFLHQSFTRTILTIQDSGTFTGGSSTSQVAGEMSLGVQDCHVAATIGSAVDPNTEFTSSNADVLSKQVKLFGSAKCKIDAVNNDFILVNATDYSSSGDRTAWEQFIQKYGIIYLEFKFYYTNPNRIFELRIYPLGAGSCGYSVTTKERFDEIVR